MGPWGIKGVTEHRWVRVADNIVVRCRATCASKSRSSPRARVAENSCAAPASLRSFELTDKVRTMLTIRALAQPVRRRSAKAEQSSLPLSALTSDELRPASNENWRCASGRRVEDGRVTVGQTTARRNHRPASVRATISRMRSHRIRNPTDRCQNEWISRSAPPRTTIQSKSAHSKRAFLIPKCVFERCSFAYVRARSINSKNSMSGCEARLTG